MVWLDTGLVDTAINDNLQTVKVNVFDADGARLNEGWGDVTKTTLTESVPGGDPQPMVMDFEVVDNDSVQEDSSFVLRTGLRQRECHRCELRIACVPLPAHVAEGWHHVLLHRSDGSLLVFSVERMGHNTNTLYLRDGPERCRHWLRHDEKFTVTRFRPLPTAFFQMGFCIVFF